MPGTAKLSQAFYDRLGHQVADEMVDWFNQVDAAYRSDLREINELNFARFDAKLEQRFAESDLRMERRFAESQLAFEQRFSALERQMAKLALDMKEQQIVQMRWMIGMWCVVLFAVMGLWIRR